MALGVGIADRFEFDDFRPQIVKQTECFELMSNGLQYDDQSWMEELISQHLGSRVHLHSTALSVCSSNLNKDEVSHFAELARKFAPATISDHFSFRAAGDMQLENFIPPILDADAISATRDNIKRIQDVSQMSFDLENVTHLIGNACQIFRERDYLLEICSALDTGIVLDVSNIFIDSINFEFDVWEYLDAIPKSLIRTVHVAGFTTDIDGQIIDTHMERISDDVLHLLACLAPDFCEDVDIVLERDNGSAGVTEILDELSRIRFTLDRALLK